MKLMILMCTFILLHLQTADASIYQCDTGDGLPRETPSRGFKPLYHKTPSIFPEIAQKSSRNLESRFPFLIYYAVDSVEAFMQYSVKYEIASLQESCKRDSNVNFVGIINSLFIKKNEIIVCKNQKIKRINLSSYPELNLQLKFKRKYISTGDHTVEDSKTSYRTAHDIQSNKPFAKYPLAHPDFLYDLVNLVTTEEDLFPSDKYVPFINLKSHGSKFNVLSGMHSCQEDAKEISSRLMLEKVLTKQEIKTLKKLDSYDLVAANLKTFESIISKIGLGEALIPGSSERVDGQLNSDFNLGDFSSGLGIDQGLGVDLAFGTGQPQLNWVLQDLFPNSSDKSLGFLMLESCDTNRDADLFHSFLNNIYGFYSAKHSLWYRNLNWWKMLEEAKGSSSKLAEILKARTAEITNIELLEL